MMAMNHSWRTFLKSKLTGLATSHRRKSRFPICHVAPMRRAFSAP
jgi:hypothetical protein